MKRMKHPCVLLALTALFVLTSGLAFAQGNGPIRSSSNLGQARRQFERAAESWLAELQQNRAWTRQTPRLERDKDQLLAVYTQIHPQSLQTAVQETGDNQVPFLGTMSYEQSIYTARGQDKEQVRQGPYQETKRVLVTRILVYSAGCWQR